MKIGIGYDIHKLKDGVPLMIGGVEIPYPMGFEAHSDGDVLLHSVCDALLGAMGMGDIGMRFPDTDVKYKGISSLELLKNVADVVFEKGIEVQNIDCVVIAEEPKLGPYREKIRRTISGVLKVEDKAVNVKGKTAEGLGPVGERKAIAAYAAVLLKEAAV